MRSLLGESCPERGTRSKEAQEGGAIKKRNLVGNDAAFLCVRVSGREACPERGTRQKPRGEALKEKPRKRLGFFVQRVSARELSGEARKGSPRRNKKRIHLFRGMDFFGRCRG